MMRLAAALAGGDDGRKRGSFAPASPMRASSVRARCTSDWPISIVGSSLFKRLDGDPARLPHRLQLMNVLAQPQALANGAAISRTWMPNMPGCALIRRNCANDSESGSTPMLFAPFSRSRSRSCSISSG